MQHVSPKDSRPARLSALAALPVFMTLRGRRAVVAGGGEAALWKAEMLAATGADVEVYAEHSCKDLIALAAEPPAGRIVLMERAWRASDLENASIAVGSLEGEEAEEFAAAARAHGVPVNIVDVPQLSEFSFGTIVNRAPVTISIGTDGTAPVLAQAIRAKIEALLHPCLGDWAQTARGLRDRIKSRLPMGQTRRVLWQRFAAAALSARTSPAAGEVEAILSETPATASLVTLVGAGPGDPELLTLKGMRALQSADVILYDRLVSPEILEFARREARRMLVGKAGGGAHCSQDDINALMVRLAKAGKHVVRLKGGDPMVFGRAAEELKACREAGIAIEIVPGITAALGAAASLQLPLTDRDCAGRVQFATGHSRAGPVPEHDWATLADATVTTVFYMAARGFRELLPRLVSAGLDAGTTAVAVAAATTPRQRSVACAVRDLPGRLDELDADQPCLIMVGGSVGQAADNDRSSDPAFATARAMQPASAHRWDTDH